MTTKIRSLPSELQLIACKELNEVPESISSELDTLKEWIEQQPHLRARTGDQFLMAFLRGCKHSMEKTKRKIDNFYTLRTKHKDELLINQKFEKYLEILRLG